MINAHHHVSGEVSTPKPILVSIPALEWFVSLFKGALFAFAVLEILHAGIALYTHDTTDAPGERSGLHTLTDALTGCQYLETSHGITPRLSRDGRPMCQ